MSNASSTTVSIHLIDPADGRALQSWTFAESRITIGRGEQESIPLADPYVSRLHAELVCAGGAWQLFARGRNGVFVAGQNVNECRLEPGATFRLGVNGPMFRFEGTKVVSNQATLSFDPTTVIVLAFDRGEAEQQAQEIAQSEYFQQLQDQARRLRHARRTSP